MLALILIYLILFALFIYLIWKLYRSGLFDTVDVSISANPPVLNKSVTIYYKHHVGPYSRLSTAYREAKSLLPDDGALIGIYYDDPQELKEHLLQSAVGVIFGEDGKDYYTEECREQLTKWGFERMILPKVDRTVVGTQKFDGYFSLFTLVNYTYPKINVFIKKHALPIRVAVEVYSNKQVHVLFPLDHHDGFVVPQLKTVEELESKLARKKWDSDIESESTSESEIDEEEGGTTDSDAGSDADIAGTNNEDKKNE